MLLSTMMEYKQGKCHRYFSGVLEEDVRAQLRGEQGTGTHSGLIKKEIRARHLLCHLRTNLEARGTIFGRESSGRRLLLALPFHCKDTQCLSIHY